MQSQTTADLRELHSILGKIRSNWREIQRDGTRVLLGLDLLKGHERVYRSGVDSVPVHIAHRNNVAIYTGVICDHASLIAHLDRTDTTPSGGKGEAAIS